MNKNLRIIIIVIGAIIVSTAIVFGLFMYNNGKKYTENNKAVVETYKYNPKDVKNINLELGNIKLEIEEANVNEITIVKHEYDGKIINVSEDKNGTVNIQKDNNSNNMQSMFGVKVGEHNQKVDTVTIKIPKGYTLDSIKGTVENGEVTLEDISSSNIDVNLENGEADLENIKGDNLSFILGNGEISSENLSVKNVTLKNANGIIELENTENKNFVIDNLIVEVQNGIKTINAKYKKLN